MLLEVSEFFSLSYLDESYELLGLMLSSPFQVVIDLLPDVFLITTDYPQCTHSLLRASE